MVLRVTCTMVRFARVKGSHSKSSFNKVAEEASSWDELKTIPSGNHVSDSNEDLAFVSREQSDVICKPPVWSTIEPEALSKKKRNDVGGGGQAYSGGRGETICRTKNHHETKATKRSRQEKEEEGVDYKRRKAEPVESILSIGGEEIKLGKFDGYVVKEEDAVRLEELRQKLKKQGEDEKKIYALVKMERRKAERSVKQKKKSLCFHCRKGGHNLSECPKLEVKGSPSGPVSGICFKCGSTEHKLPQCKSKLMTLEFATCFICGQSGHLSKNCTNNPRGLYPDGGGCKHCKDVTHYERNCPILASKKKKRQEFVSARTIDGNNIEALDYEEEVWPRTKPVHSKTHKQPKRIIKF